MVARVCRKRSEQVNDRQPISTYEDAVRALVVRRADPSISDDAYFMAVEIVADVFWIAEKHVVRDVRVAAAYLGVF